MVTPHDFRRTALSLAGSTEGQHQRHADFRAAGRIFATLGYPDAKHGAVKLTPEQQRGFMALDCGFAPAAGAWGLKGSTIVHLDSVDPATLEEALQTAWRNALAKTPTKGTRRPRADSL